MIRPISKTAPEAIVSVKRPPSPARRRAGPAPAGEAEQPVGCHQERDLAVKTSKARAGVAATRSATRTRELTASTAAPEVRLEGRELRRPQPFGLLQPVLRAAIGSGRRR